MMEEEQQLQGDQGYEEGYGDEEEGYD